MSLNQNLIRKRKKLAYMKFEVGTVKLKSNISFENHILLRLFISQNSRGGEGLIMNLRL